MDSSKEDNIWGEILGFKAGDKVKWKRGTWKRKWVEDTFQYVLVWHWVYGEVKAEKMTSEGVLYYVRPSGYPHNYAFKAKDLMRCRPYASKESRCT